VEGAFPYDKELLKVSIDNGVEKK